MSSWQNHSIHFADSPELFTYVSFSYYCCRFRFSNTAVKHACECQRQTFSMLIFLITKTFFPLFNLTTFPSSSKGTHWLAQIIMQLYTNQVTLTSPIEFGDILKLEELKNLSSRRIIPTHLDYNMLPMNFKNKGCKVKYINLILSS